MAFVKRMLSFTFQLAAGTFTGTESNTVTLIGLRASAKIIKAGGQAMGTAELTIYGVPLSIANQLSTLGMQVQLVPKNVVTVGAGDADANGNFVAANMSVVFVGTVYNAYGDYSLRPGSAFRVTAHSGAAESAIVLPPTSYDGTTDVATIMSNLASQMGIGFENNGVKSTLSNPYKYGTGWTQFQSVARDAWINATIDNVGGTETLVIWPKNGTRNGSIPLIAPPPDGNMIGYPTYTASGIRVETLFNKGVAFGGQIKVVSSLTPACNTWAIHGLDHDLESQVEGGKWQTNILAYNPKFPAPLPS